MVNSGKIKKAFSLVEILVIMTIISILTGILLPALSRVRQQARIVICRSNIRQLYLANIGYAMENDNYYVPAAEDMMFLASGLFSSGGMHRWHGVRESDGVDPDPNKNTFDPQKGPLSSSLADGEVKECPGLVDFVKEGSLNAFEAGCGGYGYNSIGVGSRSYKTSLGADPFRLSMKTTEITNPALKVMFTDTAFLVIWPYEYLIEYSFCEPPLDIWGWPTIPSIHFRHLDKANIVFCDGHVSSEPMSFTLEEQPEWKNYKIGWFGPKDNRYFRP